MLQIQFTNQLMQYLWTPQPAIIQEKEEEEPDVCAICLTVPKTKKNVSFTTCGHKFCTSCLLSSLRHKNTCPTCRAELEPERAYIEPIPVSVAAELIRDEERVADIHRRINVINAFSGTNGRTAMIFSLCREFAFNVAHGIARWQKNTTADTYHSSWNNFDDEDDDDDTDSETVTA